MPDEYKQDWTTLPVPVVDLTVAPAEGASGAAPDMLARAIASAQAVKEAKDLAEQQQQDSDDAAYAAAATAPNVAARPKPY